MMHCLHKIPLPHVTVEVRRGRFPEELNILVRAGSCSETVAAVKVFCGRPPFYRRWVEVFSVKPVLYIGGVKLVFANSSTELSLLKCASGWLGPGERLFVEYLYDAKTMRELELNVHPALTRLGFILLGLGFIWFKDWYFPEGFIEGGPKLQAEKPVSPKAKKKHLEEICSEARRNARAPGELGERARIIVSRYCSGAAASSRPQGH